MPEMDMGNGLMLDTDSGTYAQDGVNMGPADPKMLAAVNQYFQSPQYQSGRATAEAQAAAHHSGIGGDLLGLGLGAAGLYFGIPGLSELFSGAGALGGAEAAGAAGGAFDMGGMGSAANLFGAGGAAAGAGATGAAGMANGDWWSQLGLTPQDVGESANPWTTNPGMSDLTGGVLNNAGSMATPGIAQLLQQLQQIPGGAQIAQQLLGQITQQGGGGGQGGAGGGFNLGSALPLLGIGSGLNTMFNSKPAVDPNMVKALWQAGQNTYNTSLDPQQALYDRTRQQVQDQAANTNTMYGLGNSPAGAGVQNQAMNNFNIDWQNQQLARQAQGTQAFTGAGNTAANAGVAGAAQQFAQNQTGLNNLTTGAGQLFGPTTGAQGGAAGAPNMNPLGSWLNSFFSPGGAGANAGGGTFNPSSSYNSQGTFQPYYTGSDSAGGPAYG